MEKSLKLSTLRGLNEAHLEEMLSSPRPTAGEIQCVPQYGKYFEFYQNEQKLVDIISADYWDAIIQCIEWIRKNF
jgi:hypothetical protein